MIGAPPSVSGGGHSRSQDCGPQSKHVGLPGGPGSSEKKIPLIWLGNIYCKRKCRLLTPRIFDQNTISRQKSRIGFSQSVDGPDPELVDVSMPQIWTIHTPVVSALCFANGSPFRRFFRCIKCFGHVNSFNNITCNVAASVIDRRSPMYDTIIVKYVSNFDVSRRSGLI